MNDFHYREQQQLKQDIEEALDRAMSGQASDDDWTLIQWATGTSGTRDASKERANQLEIFQWDATQQTRDQATSRPHQ